MLSGVCVGLSWLKLPNVSDPTLSQRLPRIPDGLFALLRTRARVYVLWLRGTLHALLLCPNPRGEGCLVLSWLAGDSRTEFSISVLKLQPDRTCIHYLYRKAEVRLAQAGDHLAEAFWNKTITWALHVSGYQTFSRSARA